MQRPLTILHTEASDGWGGQEIRILTESEWFRKHGHTVVIATPSTGSLFLRAPQVGFHCIPIQFEKKTQLSDFFRIKKVIQSLKPDVVGTHSTVDSRVALLAAASCKTPCRIRYRHVSTPVTPHCLNKLLYRHACHGVIGTSASIVHDLIQRLEIEPTCVQSIPTGIDWPAALPEKNTARLALCQELGLPSEGRFIGQMSVLRSWKGTRILFQAFGHLALAHPSLHLVIIGNGPEKEALAELRTAHPHGNRIHLIGHRDDPWPYLRALDTAVLASTKNEGIPQAGLKALFAQCPLVGTQVGGIPEIIIEGKTGLLVPPENPSALAAAIERLLSDPTLAAHLAQEARPFVEKKHSIETMGIAVLAFFNSFLEDPSH